MRRAAKAGTKPDTEVLQHFVEEAGVAYGEMGLPPMAGRIIGWLLVCEPAEQTQADLAKELQASKGSISTMLGILLRIGIVKAVRRPGDRKEYFQLPPGGVAQQVADSSRKTAIVKGLAERGLELLSGASPERRARLEELYEFYAFLERETPALLEKFKREQQAKAKAKKRS